MDNFKFGRAWFVQNFGWDGYVKESKKVKFEDLASKDRPAKSTNFTDLGAYMAYRWNFGGTRGPGKEEDYALKPLDTLDGASNTHVLNDSKRPGVNWKTTRIAKRGEVLFAGKGSYQIEAFGSREMIVTMPGRESGLVRLQNVVLVTGFMTSIVSMKKMNEGGVHWNSEYPKKMLKDRKD